MVKKIKTGSREEWLELRKKGIGGSDAATIVGLNQYKSPYLLWLEKTGQLNEEKDNSNPAMELGTYLEDYVAEQFMKKTGKKVHRINYTLVNDEYPFAHANVDRWVYGENAGLECKTINTLSWNNYEEGEFPFHYYIQCLHYMMVTGADRFYLAVLPLQRELEWFVIERDEEAIKNLAQLEKEFWEENVKNNIAPEVDGTKPTAEALKIRYSKPDNNLDKVDLFGYKTEIQEYFRLIEEEKEIKTQIEKIKQSLQEELGAATVGETEEYRVTWKPQKRRNFQIKEFKKQNPDFDLDPYYKETTNRIFKCSKYK